MKCLFAILLSIISFICDARGVKQDTKIENAKDFIFASIKFETKDTCDYSFSDYGFATTGTLHFKYKYFFGWSNYMNEETAKFNFENNIKLKENAYKANLIKTTITCFILDQRNKAIKLRYRNANGTIVTELWSYLNYNKQFITSHIILVDNGLNSNRDLNETTLQFFRFKN